MKSSYAISARFRQGASDCAADEYTGQLFVDYESVTDDFMTVRAEQAQQERETF